MVLHNMQATENYKYQNRKVPEHSPLLLFVLHNLRVFDGMRQPSVATLGGCMGHKVHTA